MNTLLKWYEVSGVSIMNYNNRSDSTPPHIHGVLVLIYALYI